MAKGLAEGARKRKDTGSTEGQRARGGRRGMVWGQTKNKTNAVETITKTLKMAKTMRLSQRGFSHGFRVVQSFGTSRLF